MSSDLMVAPDAGTAQIAAMFSAVIGGQRPPPATDTDFELLRESAAGLQNTEQQRLARFLASRKQEEEFGFRMVGSAATTPAQLSIATVTQVVLGMSPTTPAGWYVPTGFEVEVRQVALLAVGQSKVSDPNGSYETGQTDSAAATVTGTAAAAASLTMTGFAYLSSFRVDFAAAVPAGAGVITVTGLQGGTITVEIPSGATSVVVPFPAPVATPYASAVISVPAIVGGPAYTINANGRILGSGYVDVVGSIFAGTAPKQPTATARTTNDWDVIEPICALPFKQRYSPGETIIEAGETLYAEAWNVIGPGVILTARMNLRPLGARPIPSVAL